ncbi:PrgI family protein [Candidatus Roizmanbacteria bacterium]|nr:PrgI family protein [Candidatus Roizmanbacteria bacterium]
MEQHPIPRQITSFEFKLIGFMTIKQFIYLVVFIPLGLIVYYIFPVPLLNILLGIITGGLGFAFAFLPINDRPLDVWIINFLKRMTSATQYFYHKNNEPLYFLRNLVFVNDPHRVIAHVEAQEKLANYLSAKTPSSITANPKKQTISNLFQVASSTLSGKSSQVAPPVQDPSAKPGPKVQEAQPVTVPKKPFFTGVVKNHKLIPIPGILIYVKDDKDSVLRLLKSNPHGVFATFNPLPPNEYSFEIKDPNNSYIFDTMKLKIGSENTRPFEFYSKELL